MIALQEIAPLQPEALPPLAPVLGLCAFGLLLLPSALRLLRRIAPPAAEIRPRWGVLDTLAVGSAALSALLVGSGLLPTEGILPLLRLTVLVQAAAAAVALALVRRRQSDALGALGLVPSGTARGIAAGLAAYLLSTPIVFGVGLLWPILAHALGHELSRQEVLEQVRTLSGPALAQAILIAVLVAPFLEELLFRGFLQPLLVERSGALLGIATTSAIFALLHGAAAAGPIFVLSLLLGAIRQRTRRLGPAWAVHAAHNGVTLCLAIAFSAGGG